MSKPLKVGIIGLGVGEQHIVGYQKHPKTEVVKICDINPQKLSEVATRFPIPTTTDPQKILTDSSINIVSIASFDNYHCEQIIQALNYNKHVFVEKPLCLYEHEAKKIRDKLNENPELQMSSNLVLRMSPRFGNVKSMVRQKEFGNLTYIEGAYNYGRLWKITEGWRGKLDFYSVIYGGGVHLVDLVLWICEDQVVEVMTYGNNIATRNSQFQYNDLTVTLLKFASGMLAKISCNFGCVLPHFHELRIYGTQATFINNYDCGLVYKSRDRAQQPQKLEVAYRESHKSDLIHNFIDAIVDRTPLKVSIEDVFTAMSVCFAMEKSMQTNKPITINYL